MLRYLGRYTHRVAISNHRLVSFADGEVTFRWRDSAHNNEQKLLSLSLDEFLRRFLLHVLPKGFVRIRHFGFLANRRRATTLPLCSCAWLSTPSHAKVIAATPSDAWHSPNLRLLKPAFASVFPGRYAHLSPKDTAERTFRSVSNGRRYL